MESDPQEEASDFIWDMEADAVADKRERFNRALARFELARSGVREQDHAEGVMWKRLADFLAGRPLNGGKTNVE